MDYKLDLELHKKIKELFPLKNGEAIYIEVLNANPLELHALRDDPSDPIDYSFQWARQNKSYFILDRTRNEPIFFYRDRFVSFKKNLETDQILMYQLRNQEEIDMNKVRLELKQLGAILKSQAS
jgi:hypothetical protein